MKDGIFDLMETLEAPATVNIRRVAEALQKPARDRNNAVASAVLAGLSERGRFYHIADAPSFRSALFFDATTKELDCVKSDRFVQAVSDGFAINRASPPWSYVESAIENESIGRASTPITPEAFWAFRPGAVYLSNGPGRMVRVTVKGPELVDNGTDGVLFPRGATLTPWILTTPKDPFEVCDLFSGLNATDGHGSLLAKLWALSLPTAPKNKPPLVLAGTIGSGKTRYAIGLCELYGLPTDGRTIKVEEAGEQHFWPVMDAGGMAILDNADTKARWLPDALAAASTGGGQVKRELYTDKGRVALKPRAWIAITTARPDSFAGDAGLADRLLIVRMERRSGDTKDGELSAQIAQHRDAGLSWICDMLARALGDSSHPTGSINQRHPDFALFAFRLGRALGREDDALAALKAAEADKAVFCLENDSVGAAVLAHVRAVGRFEGGAKDLLEALRTSGHIDADSLMKPKGLGKRLDNLWAHLEAVAICSREKDRNDVTKYVIRPRTNNRQMPDRDAV